MIDMDWGLITFIAVLALFIGHIAFDLRTLVANMRRLHHDTGKGQELACEKCHAQQRGGRELRHEMLWTGGAIIILTAHIVADFTL